MTTAGTGGDVLISVAGVSKRFCRDLKKSLIYGVQDTLADCFGSANSKPTLRQGEFWAIDDVSFELRRGECLGLIGRNGAGKTTLLKMLNGLIKPDKGRIEMRGRVGALIALGAGFNPILSGRENIYVNGSVLGLSKREIDDKVAEIIDFAEIGEFIDAPVQSYSSGMQVRLGFAVATALEPDILLIDEVLAVGDASFQYKCYERIGTLLEKSAVILVSHFPHHLRRVCDRGLVLHKGGPVIDASPQEALACYQKMSDSTFGPVLKILGASVQSADFVQGARAVPYGGCLSLTLAVDVESDVRCDKAVLNIVDYSGDVNAQILLDDLVHVFRRGVTQATINIENLCLAEGRYQVQLMCWTAGGKTTLVVLRNVWEFEAGGPISWGARYYPVASATFKTRADGGSTTDNATTDRA